jgi:phosphopantetheinyl transferase (holo-ACP synthase)
MDAAIRPPGAVASRFISQTELTEAQKKREEQLKEAYARWAAGEAAYESQD